MKKSLEAADDPVSLKKLSRIEIDLIREKLRTLYDRLSQVQAFEPEAEKPVEVEFEILGDQQGISPASVDEKIHMSETDTAEIESAEIISSEPKQEPHADKPAVKKTDQPDLFSLEGGEGKKQPASVAETVSGAEPEESVVDKLQKQSKVSSLKKAIGINEKFFFINELFDGSLNEYNEAIEILDAFEKEQECHAYLEELAGKFKWQGHPEAAEQLKQFLDRKFN